MPAVVPVKVAVYVPSPLSETALIVPSLVPAPLVSTTEFPPAARTFPAASRNVTVSVAVLPEAIVVVEAVSVLVSGDAVPGVTVTVGDADVTGLPPIVAPIVRAVPVVVPVKLAV